MDAPDHTEVRDRGIHHPAQRQCTATSRTTGQRCGRSAMAGATVCMYHGGGAPQVQRAARLRLLELVDPAIATLAREMATADHSADRQRAANSILDRAGVVRVEGVDPAAAQALLVQRLLALREAASADKPAPPPVVQGHLVTDGGTDEPGH